MYKQSVLHTKITAKGDWLGVSPRRQQMVASSDNCYSSLDVSSLDGGNAAWESQPTSLRFLLGLLPRLPSVKD